MLSDKKSFPVSTYWKECNDWNQSVLQYKGCKSSLRQIWGSLRPQHMVCARMLKISEISTVPMRDVHKNFSPDWSTSVSGPVEILTSVLPCEERKNEHSENVLIVSLTAPFCEQKSKSPVRSEKSSQARCGQRAVAVRQSMVQSELFLNRLIIQQIDKAVLKRKMRLFSLAYWKECNDWNYSILPGSDNWSLGQIHISFVRYVMV